MEESPRSIITPMRACVSVAVTNNSSDRTQGHRSTIREVEFHPRAIHHPGACAKFIEADSLQQAVSTKPCQMKIDDNGIGSVDKTASRVTRMSFIRRASHGGFVTPAYESGQCVSLHQSYIAGSAIKQHPAPGHNDQHGPPGKGPPRPTGQLAVIAIYFPAVTIPLVFDIFGIATLIVKETQQADG